MEKQGVPMNQYPQSPDLAHQTTGSQPPVYQDPSHPQAQPYQQPQSYNQAQPAGADPHAQYSYGNSPPPVTEAYGTPQQKSYQDHAQHQQPHPTNPGMPAQQPSGQVYQNATPLANLSRGPAPADCPACGQRAMTNTTFKTGNTTHAWAAGICFCFCLGCIPYAMSSTKDVEHKCGRCGVLLATWHRSGSTEVHVHS